MTQLRGAPGALCLATVASLAERSASAGDERIRVIVPDRGQTETDVDMSDGKDARAEVVIQRI